MSPDATLQARLEIRDAVAAMIENLKPIAERHPEAPTTGEDFNLLLDRARATFPDSAALRDTPCIDKGTNVVDLLLKLAVVQGAVGADFSARGVAETEAYNRRVDREWR